MQKPIRLEFSDEIRSLIDDSTYKHILKKIIVDAKSNSKKINHRAREVLSPLQINPLSVFVEQTPTRPLPQQAVYSVPAQQSQPSSPQVVASPVSAQQVVPSSSPLAEVKDEKQMPPSAGRKPSFSR